MSTDSSDCDEIETKSLLNVNRPKVFPIIKDYLNYNAGGLAPHRTTKVFSLGSRKKVKSEQSVPGIPDNLLQKVHDSWNEGDRPRPLINNYMKESGDENTDCKVVKCKTTPVEDIHYKQQDYHDTENDVHSEKAQINYGYGRTSFSKGNLNQDYYYRNTLSDVSDGLSLPIDNILIDMILDSTVTKKKPLKTNTDTQKYKNNLEILRDGIKPLSPRVFRAERLRLADTGTPIGFKNTPQVSIGSLKLPVRNRALVTTEYHKPSSPQHTMPNIKPMLKTFNKDSLKKCKVNITKSMKAAFNLKNDGL